MEGFLLHASNRLETLAELLARVLATPLDPMLPETVLVQSGGMQRWVSMQLARRHGVCANVRFPFPVGFAYEVCRTLLADLPREYPLNQERMLWSIERLLRPLLDDPEFAPLARYVRDDSQLKTVQLAERIAFHFDQYLIFRPAWSTRWEAGETSGDFTQPAHAASEAWQARLWRELVGDMSVRGAGGEHRAALLKRAIARLERGKGLSDLPSRVCVFGIPTLPPVYLDLLTALSRHSQVHVFLLSPCRKYWGDLMTQREQRRAYLRQDHDAQERPEDSLPLAGLGGVGRDFLELLLDRNPEETRLYEIPDNGRMLGRLQADLLDMNVDGDRPDFTDTSIQVHCCHSPLREMETLKDLILDLLSEDTTLTPQDILVMNPDIESYAPVIQAVFGTSEVPFSISDRKPTRAAETIRLFLELLEFGQHRFEASRVCALLEAPPVRQRLGLDASETQRVLEWVRSSGIRWGLDKNFRNGMGGFAQNTWESGLARLFLGYMSGAAAPLHGISPLALRGSSEQELLGRVAAWVDDLGTLWSRLQGARKPADWLDCLLWVLDAFFPQDRDQAEHVLAVRRTVTDLTREMGDFEADGRTMLYLIRKRLDESGGESGFLASGLTFCGLKPMRSIPFRVVCLTGLTSTAFPRQDTPPGFDLMALRPRPGDRSLREDDRYLFLESIISARDSLILTYPGLSQSDNAEAPPSVLVSELLDFLDGSYTVGGRKPSETLVLRHRLQAFHPDYFTEGSRLFSYSQQNRDAARALFERQTAGRFFPAELSPAAADEVDIEELTRFLAHPCRHLLRALRIDPVGGEDEFLDEEPLATPRGLDAYGPLQTLLHTALHEPATDLEGMLLAWQILPPGQAGTDAGGELCARIRTLAEQLRAFIDDEAPTRRDLRLVLEAGILTGRIDLHGDRIVTCRPAGTKGPDMLRLWVRHLAATAAGVEAQSIHLGAGDSFTAPEAGDSRERLTNLLALYARGMRAPLPFFPRTSLAYAKARFTGRKPKDRAEALAAAMKQWEGGFNITAEKDDPHLAFLFRDAEPDWDEFAEVAELIYAPLFGGTA